MECGGQFTRPNNGFYTFICEKCGANHPFGSDTQLYEDPNLIHIILSSICINQVEKDDIGK